jgi:hypothetical protein
VNGYPVASLVELGRGCQPARARAYDCYSLVSTLAWWVCLNPTCFEAFINNCGFDIFDGHGWIGNPQYACAFAGSRADPAGKFREVVCFMETMKRFVPVTTINQIIPFRY